MKAVLDIILIILQIGIWVVIAQAILSWLVAFNVVNTSNQFVATVWRSLHQITEPVLRPIRRILPSAGGMDFSPMVLILGIIFLRQVIWRYGYPNVF
ncbi:MAG: YggT family protein [Hyphomonadaceae bacterium]